MIEIILKVGSHYRSNMKPVRGIAGLAKSALVIVSSFSFSLAQGASA